MDSLIVQIGGVVAFAAAVVLAVVRFLLVELLDGPWKRRTKGYRPKHERRR